MTKERYCVREVLRASLRPIRGSLRGECSGRRGAVGGSKGSLSKIDKGLCRKHIVNAFTRALIHSSLVKELVNYIDKAISSRRLVNIRIAL